MQRLLRPNLLSIGFPFFIINVRILLSTFRDTSKFLTNKFLFSNPFQYVNVCVVVKWSVANSGWNKRHTEDYSITKAYCNNLTEGMADVWFSIMSPVYWDIPIRHVAQTVAASQESVISHCTHYILGVSSFISKLLLQCGWSRSRQFSHRKSCRPWNSTLF